MPTDDDDINRTEALAGVVELVGLVAIVVGVVGLLGVWWACLVAGVILVGAGVALSRRRVSIDVEVPT